MQLHLNNDDAWERFCSSEEYYSTTTATVSTAEKIFISTNPPTHLLEIALTKLSQIVKFSTHLNRIRLGRWVPLEPRVVSTACEALIHSRVQQKIKVGFSFHTIFFERMTCEQFLPIANLMKNCKREIGIDISLSKVQDDGVSDLLADAVRDMVGAVLELDLKYCGLGDDEVCALAENLMVNTTLTTLTLSNNKIGDKGAKALAEALKHNGALTKLNIWDNSIGKKGGVAIGNALLCNRTLERLNLGKNAIGDEGALALAAGLRGGSSLKELLVSDAKIGKKGGVALGEALAFCPTLETLHISANLIGDEGAVAIASSLVRNTTLKLLGLCYIGMGTEGCSALAGALRSNTSLEDIDIGGNRIGDEGVVAVAGALKDNASLKWLQMKSCGIGDEGAVALAEAIACNVTMEYLDLCDNRDITEDVGITAFRNGLNRNSTLKGFFLHANNAGIEFALRRNKALLKEPAWMKRFSDQDIRLKGKFLAKAMERYSRSEFSELTFLFLKSQVSTIAETNALSHPSPDE